MGKNGSAQSRETGWSGGHGAASLRPAVPASLYTLLWALQPRGLPRELLLHQQQQPLPPRALTPCQVRC